MDTKVVKIKSIRINYLDGIRGWAAISVVFYHIFYESFGRIIPVYRSIVFAGFLNGGLAVYIFFVVSGAALSVPFFRSKEQSFVLRSALTRYPRLMLPIMATSILLFVFYHLGMMHGKEAAILLDRVDWTALNYLSCFGIKDVIYYALSNVFTDTPGEQIITFLWTMPIELMGSILLFLYLALYENMRHPGRVLCPIIIILFFIYPQLSCFFLGFYLSFLQTREEKIKIIESTPIKLIIIIAVIAYMFLSMQLSFLKKPQFYVMNSFFICYFCISIRPVRQFLSNKFSIFLGKISFPIYLMHFITIEVVLSPLVLASAGHLNLMTTFVIGMITAAASILAAIVFRPIEKLSHRIANFLTAKLLDSETNNQHGTDLRTTEIIAPKLK